MARKGEGGGSSDARARLQPSPYKAKRGGMFRRPRSAGRDRNVCAGDAHGVPLTHALELFDLKIERATPSRLKIEPFPKQGLKKGGGVFKREEERKECHRKNQKKKKKGGVGWGKRRSRKVQGTEM